MNKTRINVPIDSTLKDAVDEILMDLGLTPDAAITMFYQQIKDEGGLPFQDQPSQRQRNIRELQKLAADTDQLPFPNKAERDRWLWED